jgi:ABC-type multidrug transport system fused ATPase/permease subunit
MFLSLTSMMLMQLANTPLLVVLFLPVFGVYLSLQRYYRYSCRELQRLDSITKSPIYAYFTETLSGLMTIRAFQASDRCLNEQAHRLNQNTRVFLTLNLINRWLGIRLEALGALITLGVACLVSHEHLILSSAIAGLLLSYTQSITGLLNWIVRNNMDMENMMNSVERTEEYSSVEVEAIDMDKNSEIKPSNQLQQHPQWPKRGEIKFVNIYVSFHSLAAPVLQDVTIEIKGGANVGICGRTGQ